MGQGADQVRRGETYRLRQGESIRIAPGAESETQGHDMPGEYRTSGHAVPAGIGMMNTDVVDAANRPPDNPEAIEAGIEQTRSDLSETLNAIQQRLSPDNLKEEAKDQASELAEHAKQAAREAVQHAFDEARMHAREAIQEARDVVREATIGKVENMARMVSDTTEDTRYGIVETIKQNPLPAALAGIGLAWLMMNRQSAPQRPQRHSYLDDRGYGRVRNDRYSRGDDGRGYGYEAYSSRPGYAQRQNEAPGLIDRVQGTAGQAADQVGQVASSAGSAIGQAADQVGETASALVGQAQEATGNLVDQAQQQTRRVEDRVGRAMQDTPLAVGAVALALGAAIGLAVPGTAKEQEMFGPMRDNLIDQAQGLAQEAIGKVQAVASEAGQTVQHEAQAQGLMG